MSSSAVLACPGLLCFPASVREDKPTRRPCKVLERDGKWLRLQTQQPLSWAAVVGVEYSDLYCAGEVVRCVAQSEDVWLVQIEVAQVITHLQNLLRLHQELGIAAGLPDNVSAPTDALLSGSEAKSR